MKFSIRYADRIVGILIVLALGIVIFAIFMLGSNQRWFSRDSEFKSYFGSATGLSQNMPVQYKGFNIGRVKSIKLSEDDRVEVRFIIFDTYIDRVKEGSLVQVVTSPIGALGGSQFLFYPGRGTELIEKDEAASTIPTIPVVNSPEAKAVPQAFLPFNLESDDDINKIITKVGEVLTTLDEALKGNSESDNNITKTIAGINDLLATLNDAFKDNSQSDNNINQMITKVNDVLAAVDGVVVTLNNVIKGNNETPLGQVVEELSNKLTDSDGSIAKILLGEGEMYTGIANSLKSLSDTLVNLEKITGSPELALIISQLQTAIGTADDVLVGLTNNPLLKGGIPEQKEANIGGAQARDLEF